MHRSGVIRPVSIGLFCLRCAQSDSPGATPTRPACFSPVRTLGQLFHNFQYCLMSCVSTVQYMDSTVHGHYVPGERKCAENYNKWHNKFFFLTAVSVLVISSHNTQVPNAVLFNKIASVYFIWKYIYILALEMASQGNSTVPIVSAHFHSPLNHTDLIVFDVA